MEEKTICITGDHRKWCKWKLKFLSKALYIGYCNVLLGKEAMPKDSDVLDLSTNVSKQFDKARVANRMAYSALALACKEAALGITKKSVSTDLLDGDAAMAWKNLLAKYKPTTKCFTCS